MSVDEIRTRALPILRRHRIGRAALFGSVVRGEATQDSDIDLLVEMPADTSLLDLAGLQLDLEESLKRRVDVVTYRSLHPLLRERILAERQEIL